MPAIKPPPPTGTKIASSAARLAQHLHADSALAGDDFRIVIRMHETLFSALAISMPRL
jgi:hypothetical protein